jgi:hypothetical protein
MPETQFIETEALLRAMQDAEVDSGDTEATLTYLRDNFMPGELRRLEAAVTVLDECIYQVRKEKAREALDDA